jgi:serine O-acetyltransferase
VVWETEAAPRRANESLADRIVRALIGAQRRPRPLGPAAYHLLALRGTEIPASVQIGEGLVLRHSGHGVFVHPDTVIGRDVTIYQGVTIGRSDVWRAPHEPFAGFLVEDRALLCARATIISPGRERLVVARDSVIGAGAVLTGSTGPGEIWAGVPARRVGHVADPTS